MSQTIANTYEIQQQIGSGGGGVVYLAQHLRLEKPVVVKMDKRSVTVSTEKLRREIEALKNLNHTYIPQVYDFIVENNSAYTVIAYIEGESFDKPLSRGERFSQPSVVKWTRQLLEALSYMHTRPPHGVLHADIKPANIMITENDDICLIDFNIALALGEEGAVSVGRSFGYASPEHYGQDYSSRSRTVRRDTMKATENEKNPETVLGSGATTVLALQEEYFSGDSQSSSKRILLDVRSDIYSLGATLYHIMTGKRPSKDAMEVEPVSLATFSPTFVAIIAKAMNPNPALRYQTAAEMLTAVNNIHKGDLRYRRLIRNRYLAGIVLSVFFLTSGFCMFAGLKRMEQAQSALALSEYSISALAEGNTALAVEYALSALPAKSGILTPPPAPQAQNALATALGVYDLADGYKASGSIELPSPPLKIVVSPNGVFVAAIYAYEIAIFEPETAQILVRLPVIRSSLADAVFANDSLLIYAGESGVCAYDIAQRQELWKGKPTTEIAVSADGQTVATVNKDAFEAVIYNIYGQELTTIFFEGRKQRIPENDTLGNPGDNLFALNRDGSLLAVSFSNGSLDIFDISGDDIIPVQSVSDFTHFEGGFSGDYFAFSAMGENIKSTFASYDMQQLIKKGGFESDSPFYVLADEKGVFLSNDNVLVELNPETGEQREVAHTDKGIMSYMNSSGDIIVATRDNSFHLFDRYANQIDSFLGEHSYHFVEIAGDFALAGGRDSPHIRILRRKDYAIADIFTYDPAYFHDEVRINAAGDRAMLFSYKGLRLYDIIGSLLHETYIPDAGLVYDQQYSPASGNLTVIYKDALRIYSGENGRLLYEKTELQSVLYAPYGISILDRYGTVSLIDRDTAETISEMKTNSNFAAVCGMVVDSEFLGKREIIGATKAIDGYFFAVSDGVAGAVYDGDGNELFDFYVNGKSEALFTEDFVVISPLHGTPIAYNRKTGKKIRSLEPDSYMTYFTQSQEYAVGEYVSSDGTRFGILMDSQCETIAQLPGLTDIAETTLFFDYKTGYVRKTEIYSLDELIQIARGE